MKVGGREEKVEGGVLVRKGRNFEGKEETRKGASRGNYQINISKNTTGHIVQ